VDPIDDHVGLRASWLAFRHEPDVRESALIEHWGVIDAAGLMQQLTAR
jgi:hypothetical protein